MFREARGDLWDFAGEADAIVVTTNGFVKTNGEAVMGRGCAREAANRWPWLPAKLGGYLKRFGNRPFRFGIEGFSPDLLTFPVKPVRGEDGKPGWACEADLDLILDSADYLMEMADKYAWSNVYVPRPGCGNGRLSWEDVAGPLGDALDDRFVLVTW